MLKIHRINNTNTIKTGLLAGIMALSLTSCRKPLHQIETSNPDLLEMVDNFTKSEFNNPDTVGLENFKIDTVSFSKKDLENPADFSKRLTTLARSRNPHIITKEELKYGYTVGPHMSMTGFKTKSGFDYHMEREYGSKYIDSTIVTKAQNKVYTNENETKFYIPVEYYGKLDSTNVKSK